MYVRLFHYNALPRTLLGQLQHQTLETGQTLCAEDTGAGGKQIPKDPGTPSPELSGAGKSPSMLGYGQSQPRPPNCLPADLSLVLPSSREMEAYELDPSTHLLAWGPSLEIAEASLSPREQKP